MGEEGGREGRGIWGGQRYVLVDGLFLLVYRVEFVRDARKNSRRRPNDRERVAFAQFNSNRFGSLIAV